MPKLGKGTSVFMEIVSVTVLTCSDSALRVSWQVPSRLPYPFSSLPSKAGHDKEPFFPHLLLSALPTFLTPGAQCGQLPVFGFPVPRCQQGGSDMHTQRPGA